MLRSVLPSITNAQGVQILFIHHWLVFLGQFMLQHGRLFFGSTARPWKRRLQTMSRQRLRHFPQQPLPPLPPPTVLQRSEIVKAAYEPTDEECKWTADEEEELTVSKQVLVTYTPACPPSRFALESLHALCTQPVEPSEPDRHTLPQLNRK